MAKLGSADLLVVPKFDGLTAKINSALGKVDTSASGKKMGTGLFGGMTASFGKLAAASATGQVAAQAISRGMDMVAEHVGSAVSRIDTLKNYPKVMTALGVGANEAQASIDTMSDRLSNLPTRLDSMASTVQGLYAATKDYGVSLTTATDAGLALNDMLLAGGQGTEVANSAMEQFRQMLSKGKPDMQDWKSLLSAAPGQMDQLAKSMLGPTANANDLYAALGGGKNPQTITMSQLLDSIIKLDSQGGAGLASFRDQAVDATGGIQTAMDNFGNAWTKGIAKVMDSIGRENIVAPINAAKTAVGGLFDVVANGTKTLADGIRYMDDGKGALRRIGDAMQAVSGPAGGVASSMGILGQTIEDAMARAEKSQQKAKESHQAYLDQLAKSAQVIEEANAKYQSQVTSLEYAGSVIDAYAGKTGLSTAQQRELRDAVDTVNASCGTQYQVMEDGSTVIDGNTGEVQDNTQAIWDNIRAREAAAKADFYMTSKLEADQAYAKAANEFQDQKQAMSDSSVAVQALVDEYGSLQAVMQKLGETDSMGRPTRDAIEAQKVWGGFKRSANALKDADNAQRQAAQSSRELAAESAALQAKAAGAELSISQLALTTDVAAQAFNDGGSKAKYSIEDFGTALDAASANDDALRKAMGDPETMAKIVAAYDGSAASLQGVLSELGIGFDDAAAKAADANGTISQMGDWISGLSDDAYAAMAIMGLSADDLAAKLAGSGVSMEQLNQIGSENFAQLVQNCGGDIGALIGAIELYNQAPLYDKETGVYADSAQLVDAQGNVYTWNGTELLDKDSSAVVNDVSLVDSQGNVYTWNASDLDGKSTFARVTGNAADGSATSVIVGTNQATNAMQSKAVSAIVNGNASDGSAAGNIWNTVSAIGSLFSKRVTTTVDNIVNNITNSVKHASGGVRYHASGVVLTKPTWIGPNDVAGEAGDEWYDGTNIVPLTSSRARPLARVVAQEVARMGGTAPAIDYALLAQLLAQSVDGMHVVMDGDAMIGRIETRRNQIKEMYVG